MVKKNAHAELVLSQIRSVYPDNSIVVPIPPRPNNSGDKRVEIPVLCLGDWHVGYNYTHGPYAYNFEIASNRVTAAVDKFISTTEDRRNSAQIDELRLYLIGDMVEGESMRQGHSHEIEMPVVEQAMRYAPTMLASAIAKLMANFDRIKIVGVPGNHGRNGPYKSDAHVATNWDNVCYETTRLIVEGNAAKAEYSVCELEWDLPLQRFSQERGDIWYTIDYVFDWCNCITHGENVSGKSWGGIPFYGVERMMSRYADILADPLDFLYIGHIHVDANIPSNYREVFVNGAVESSSTFVRKELVSGSPPSQSAVFYSEDYGPISRHTFYLGERMPAGTRTMEAIAARSR